MADNADLPPGRDPKNPLRTRPLQESDAPPATPRQTGPLDAGLGPPWVVELLIAHTPITVRMYVQNTLVLGRSDVSADIYPDLDLTPYGGLEKGVSRQHAAIKAGPDRLLIVDLGSTNGTYINGHRLEAHEPYRLRHGDDIHLGHLRIQVNLEVVPVHENALYGQPWVRWQAEPAPGDGQRVLIVESNPDVCAVLGTILTGYGYVVDVVVEVVEAYFALARRTPDVLVMNLGADYRKALELCRHIRHAKRDRYVAIVVISEDAAGSHVREAMEAGVDVFLGKPLGVNELVRVIASVVQGSGQGEKRR